MVNKYNDIIPNEILHSDFLRLMNQLWKLIPMRENGENWERQLSLVTIEIAGLGTLFRESLDFTILLSKLEGLLIDKENIDFSVPRMSYCTDNAAMIGAAAYYAYKKGIVADQTLTAMATDTLYKYK